MYFPIQAAMKLRPNIYAWTKHVAKLNLTQVTTVRVDLMNLWSGWCHTEDLLESFMQPWDLQDYASML